MTSMEGTPMPAKPPSDTPATDFDQHMMVDPMPEMSMDRNIMGGME